MNWKCRRQFTCIISDLTKPYAFMNWKCRRQFTCSLTCCIWFGSDLQGRTRCHLRVLPTLWWKPRMNGKVFIITKSNTTIFITSKVMCTKKLSLLCMTDYIFFLNSSSGRQMLHLTRGSQEPVIAHLVFNLTSKVDRNGGVTHNFESGSSKDHFN